VLLRVRCTVCPDERVGVQYPDPTLSLAPSVIAQVLEIRELTSARIFAPGAATASPAMLATLQTGAFSFEPAARPLLELGFDSKRQGGRADLRPALPLVLLW